MVLWKLTRHFHPVLFLQAWPKTRVSERVPRSALVVFAHVFSWPPVHLWAEVGLDYSTVGTSCRVTKSAEPSLHKQCRYTCKSEAAPQFHRWHAMFVAFVSNSVDAVIARPPTSFRRLLVQAMSRNRRAGWNAPLPGRPCPVYATIFHAATKDRIAGERMRNEQD